MIAVINAKYISEYKLSLRFNDGRIGVVDLYQLTHKDSRKILSELKNVEKFKDFKVEFDTVCWSNGLDIAPEYLYFSAFNSQPELQEQFEKWGYVKTT